LVTIKRRAFVGCTHLNSIVLPASVEILEEGCFKGLTALEEVGFEVVCMSRGRRLLARNCCESISRLATDFSPLIGVLLRVAMDGR
jgi:hypothetical protein